MHGTLVCHSWVFKNKICVALMGQNVIAAVALLWIQSKGKYFPPSMAGMKTRNNIREWCLLDQDIPACVGKQK